MSVPYVAFITFLRSFTDLPVLFNFTTFVCFTAWYINSISSSIVSFVWILFYFYQLLTIVSFILSKNVKLKEGEIAVKSKKQDSSYISI